MKRSVTTSVLWFAAVAAAMAVAVFQRTTGPTWPVQGQAMMEGKPVQFRFSRSHTAATPMKVAVRADGPGLNLTLAYRRFRAGDNWSSVAMDWDGDAYSAFLPGQPPAGKMEYRVYTKSDANPEYLGPSSIVVRFKGEVPAVLLFLHILFMMAGIVLCVRTGLESLRNEPRLTPLMQSTLTALIGGGLVFGPLVQKYAFGDLWTGFPLGTDFTDNKTLLVVLFWIAAYFLYRRSRWWVFAAAVLMIAVTLIPHSMGGSELDYATGGMKNKFSRQKIGYPADRPGTAAVLKRVSNQGSTAPARITARVPG